MLGLAEDLQHVETVEALSRGGAIAQPLPAGPDTIALIQYTSGSTGDPKGVVLTHANLLASIRAMGEALDASSSDVFVSWLPLYHDMGLIGAGLARSTMASRRSSCRLSLFSPIQEDGCARWAAIGPRFGSTKFRLRTVLQECARR